MKPKKNDKYLVHLLQFLKTNLLPKLTIYNNYFFIFLPLKDACLSVHFYVFLFPNSSEITESIELKKFYNMQMVLGLKKEKPSTTKMEVDLIIAFVTLIVMVTRYYYSISFVYLFSPL